MIRVVLLAAPMLFLGACGGPETSQTNNNQANMSNSASPATTGNGMAMIAVTRVGGPEAKRIMHQRHEGMEAIGKANKALHRELHQRPPNLAAVRASAKTVADLARKASGWFPQGTGPEVGKTGAKPAIWHNPSDFAAKLRDFQAEAKAFNAAAVGHDVELIRTQYGDLNNACKACHDKYRSEMKH